MHDTTEVNSVYAAYNQMLLGCKYFGSSEPVTQTSQNKCTSVR